MLNNLQHNIFPAKRNEKPLELYLFFNPLNEKSWDLEQLVRKLKLTYGNYFKLRYVLNVGSCISCEQKENDTTIFYAIKAAELQGHRLGTEFIQRLFDSYYIGQKNIYDKNILSDIANESGLDVSEFQLDLTSSITEKAFLCDQSIATEMDVRQSPCLVFFNRYHDEEGLKIDGLHALDIYQHIFCELLKSEPKLKEDLTIEDCMEFLRFSTCTDIANILNLTEKKVTCELKKLSLQSKVKQTLTQQGVLWKKN